MRKSEEELEEEQSCVMCENVTIMMNYCECGDGPFCSDCWEEHKYVCTDAWEMGE